MVVISMRQKVNLVSEDYYQEELDYQDQIFRTKNFNELEVKPSIQLDRERKVIIFSIPKSEEMKNVNGVFHLFRPSDSALDRKLDFDLQGGEALEIDFAELQGGRWLAKVTLHNGVKGFYIEKDISL